jgi:ATP-dependent DNA ligase
VDVWFEPVYVWEIKGADLQISPVYTAGIGEIDDKKVIKIIRNFNDRFFFFLGHRIKIS